MNNHIVYRYLYHPDDGEDDHGDVRAKEQGVPNNNNNNNNDDT